MASSSSAGGYSDGKTGNENCPVAAHRARDIERGTAAELIRNKVAAVGRRLGLQTADREDLIQSLSLHLWNRVERYDAQRGGWPTFCRVVVDRHLKTLLRRKRRVLLARATSLPVDHNVGRDHRLAGPRVEPYASTDLRLDVEGVISRLPPPAQDLCRRVQRASPSQVARDLQIPRQTLVDRLRRLGPRFQELRPRDSRSAP